MRSTRWFSVLLALALAAASLIPATPATASLIPLPAAPAIASHMPAALATSHMPATASHTPAAPVTAHTCRASGPNGSCGPYAYRPISHNDHNTFVNLGGWNCSSSPGCGPLSETVTNPGHFTVSADEPAGNTAVMMMPSVYQVWWTSSKGLHEWPIAKMRRARSSFAQSMPTGRGTIAWANYDMFIDHPGTKHNEMMVQVQNKGGCITCAAVAGRATFAGQKWVLHIYGGEMIWNLDGNPAEARGTVHLLMMLRWLQRHRFIGARAAFSSVAFGWEVCSTGGRPEKFSVSSYTLKVR
jgi:hypothetical protein